jgi:hypothetical protein
MGIDVSPDHSCIKVNRLAPTLGGISEGTALASVDFGGHDRGDAGRRCAGSPLLANLYMRRFVLGWKKLGLERSLGTRLVTYADDLVILCRKGKAEEALQRLREIMGRLKLAVNEEKTRICKVPEEEFDFLGYSVLQAHTERSSSWTDQSCGQAA